MTLKKEQKKSPKTFPKEMKIYEQPDNEIQIIKKLTEL